MNMSKKRSVLYPHFSLTLHIHIVFVGHKHFRPQSNFRAITSTPHRAPRQNLSVLRKEFGDCRYDDKIFIFVSVGSTS